MKSKIVVRWNEVEESLGECNPDMPGVSFKRRTWAEQELPADIYENAMQPLKFELIWDEETILEDMGGDIHFSRDEVVDIFETYLADEELVPENVIRGGIYEVIDLPITILLFASWVRSLPKGAWVDVVKRG